MNFLTNLDMNQNQVMNLTLQKLASPPTNPVSGQIYFNTTSARAFVYKGTEWIGMDSIEATMTAQSIVQAINGSTYLIDNDNLSEEVNNAITKAHDSHLIADVTGLQTALNGKIDKSQVLTNVPANAKFTDTTYEKFTSSADGLTPKSDGGTSRYLRADGTWVVPPNAVYTLPVAGVNIGGVKTGGSVDIDTAGTITVKNDSHNHTIAKVTGLQNALDSKETPAGATTKASTAENNAKAYTDTKLSDLIGSAPEALDTLYELAQALGEDPNFATTIIDRLADKTKKYSESVGNGTDTSFVVTHGLSTRDVNVMLRQTSSPYAQVFTDVEMTSADTITIKFAEPPTSGEYTVTIIG